MARDVGFTDDSAKLVQDRIKSRLIQRWGQNAFGGLGHLGILRLSLLKQKRNKSPSDKIYITEELMGKFRCKIMAGFGGPGALY